MIEGKESAAVGRPLRYGMVGGGPGSFIGGVHRSAIAFGGYGTLVAGCFSRNPANSAVTGRELHLDPERVYASFEEMAKAEAKREDAIDFVVIAAQNDAHYPAARAFLEQGIHVMCEKPLSHTLEQALELKALAKRKRRLFGVAYAYAGHVMAKEAREIVRSGQIGDILMVMGEYPQEWLMDLLEKVEGQRQAAWRTDPKQAGISNCLGDIGTHIENMVSMMTGLKIRQVCASLDVIGKGRALDTNAQVMLRFSNGAKGMYWSSQIACGYDNGLKVRIFGTKGAVEFVQEESNYLKLTMKGQPSQRLSRGNGYLHPAASRNSRFPSGHPEGYNEAFANLYGAFTAAVRDAMDGKKAKESDYDYPKIDEGIDGVKFVGACVESSRKGSVWVDVG
jgi:predicted dehydrogenase